MNQFSVHESVKSASAMNPQSLAATGGYVAQLTIDRLGYESAKLVCKSGAAINAPATQSLKFKLQEGDAANGSDAADIASAKLGVGQTSWEVELTTDNEIGYLGFQTTQLKRYITLTVSAAFTGGAAPENILDAVLEMGVSYQEPV